MGIPSSHFYLLLFSLSFCINLVLEQKLGPIDIVLFSFLKPYILSPSNLLCQILSNPAFFFLARKKKIKKNYSHLLFEVTVRSCCSQELFTCSCIYCSVSLFTRCHWYIVQNPSSFGCCFKVTKNEYFST